MTGSLLLRGMIAGLVAGLLAFGFARTFGEPSVDRAIAFEEQMAAAEHAPEEPELVSRSTQAGIGLFTGIMVYSAAVGGIFSLVFASLFGRAGSGLTPRALAASLFGMGAAFTIAGKLRTQMGIWNASLVAGLAYIVFIAVVDLLLPAINEVPENFPAMTLYHFRIASVGIHVVIWTVLALLFGYLADRQLRQSGNYRAA